MIRKADWIAAQLEASGDDVYDVLLGNITLPTSFVNEVHALENDYDRQLRERTFDRLVL